VKSQVSNGGMAPLDSPWRRHCCQLF